MHDRMTDTHAQHATATITHLSIRTTVIDVGLKEKNDSSEMKSPIYVLRKHTLTDMTAKTTEKKEKKKKRNHRLNTAEFIW